MKRKFDIYDIIEFRQAGIKITIQPMLFADYSGHDFTGDFKVVKGEREYTIFSEKEGSWRSIEPMPAGLLEEAGKQIENYNP